MLSRLFLRRVATEAQQWQQSLGIVPKSPRYKKIQDAQNAFLRDDGLMVWQKKGTQDSMPYYMTLALTGSGFISLFIQLYGMFFKSQPEECE